MNRLRCAQLSSLASGANPYRARYSRSDSSGSMASALTPSATRTSLCSSTRRPNSPASPWRPSTSATSTRRPRPAAATASPAATVVLPVPPLPVTTSSRAWSSTSSMVAPS